MIKKTMKHAFTSLFEHGRKVAGISSNVGSADAVGIAVLAGFALIMLNNEISNWGD